jgi:hypothetical protein
MYNSASLSKFNSFHQCISSSMRDADRSEASEAEASHVPYKDLPAARSQPSPSIIITRILSRSPESHCTYSSVPNSPYFSQRLHRSPILAVQFPVAFRLPPTHQRFLGANLLLTFPVSRSTSAPKEEFPSTCFFHSHRHHLPRIAWFLCIVRPILFRMVLSFLCN